MNLKHRVDKLERMRGIKDNPYLWDIAIYEDVPIVLEGVRYVAVEDIPAAVLKKHREQLIVGRITSKHGWVENIHAPTINDEPEQAAKSQESKQ